MGSGWYASRKGVPASAESHTVRLYMDPKWWDVLDRECERKEWTRGHMVALIVRAWCKERESLDRHAKMVATANEITEDMAARGPQ